MTYSGRGRGLDITEDLWVMILESKSPPTEVAGQKIMECQGLKIYGAFKSWDMI